MDVFGNLINGLCRSANITAVLKLDELINTNGEFGVVLSYSSIINGLCKDGLVDKAKEFFFGYEEQGN